MNKLRLGVIGAGSVVREIYQHLYLHSDYSPYLEIAAVAEPNERSRDWFGDLCGIPAERRFTDYREMLDRVDLHAAQVNTPDHLHAAPAIAALEQGLDVLIPKPTAATVADAHAIIDAAEQHDCLLGIDFHKREDPRIRETEARYRGGRYGQLQCAVWYMLDVLKVVDPNEKEQFFATPDFAAENTPISFLTVHMADALLKIVGLMPVEVRATGWSQKLPSLQPTALDGYDLCDTEIRFENGAVAHVVTGWAIPNSAWALTVQSSRLICTDGLIDLDLDLSGHMEMHADGMHAVNSLFRTFAADGSVSGYGIDSPGRLLQAFHSHHFGELSESRQQAMMTPWELGFYTTAILAAAEASLETGTEQAKGVTVGPPIDLKAMLIRELGLETSKRYLG